MSPAPTQSSVSFLRQDVHSSPSVDLYQCLIEDLLPPEINFLDPEYWQHPKIDENWNYVPVEAAAMALQPSTIPLTSSVIHFPSHDEFNVAVVDSFFEQQPLTC